MATDKSKTTLFDDWSTAELELRLAHKAYKEATRKLVEKIIEVNVSWPCAMEDSEFVTVESESGPVMLELHPYDNPENQHAPFEIHHLEALKL